MPYNLSARSPPTLPPKHKAPAPAMPTGPHLPTAPTGPHLPTAPTAATEPYRIPFSLRLVRHLYEEVACGGVACCKDAVGMVSVVRAPRVTVQLWGGRGAPPCAPKQLAPHLGIVALRKRAVRDHIAKTVPLRWFQTPCTDVWDALKHLASKTQLLAMGAAKGLRRRSKCTYFFLTVKSPASE